MDIKDLKNFLTQNNLERKAWKPLTEESDSLPLDSKFSGLPFLNENEDWPVCKICNEKMPLIIQIDLKSLPVKDFGEVGLLQVFFCLNQETNCDIDDSMYTRNPENQLCRVIFPNKNSEGKTLSTINDIPSRKILEWEYIGAEYPYDHQEIQNISFTDEEKDVLYDIYHEVYNKDKLLGWPLWIQYPYYPLCRICDKKMEYVLQVVSEDNFDYIFGDGGTGYLTQCSEHKDIMSFFTFSC